MKHICLLGLSIVTVACSSTDAEQATTDASAATDSSQSNDSQSSDSQSSDAVNSDVSTDATVLDTSEPVVTNCSGWDLLTTFYPDVEMSTLRTCTDAKGALVANSVMRFDGITITGGSVVGADGTNVAAPCVEVLCDDDYAYIASNALPHYDPVAQPIFDTVDTPIVHRIPLSPTPIDASTAADSWIAPSGCDAALSMAVVNTTPSMPPSSQCWYETEDGSANTGTLYNTDGTDVVHKILCYGQTAGLITGVPAFGPCEEARPDPYGSPLFSTWANPETVFVDFCGTHPAGITHNHWINEVCLEQNEDNSPKNSYATGAVAFELSELDAATCDKESDIVGWAYDGYSMRGSCLCMARDQNGDCTDLRRARSGYVYSGLSRWSDASSSEPNAEPSVVDASYFSKELDACTTQDECCPNGGVCRLYCHPLLVTAADGSTEFANRCVTPDYSWCGHDWVDRPDPLLDTGYVYLDRCNGVETADGYTYVGTSTFPYVNGCYKGQPTSMATDDTYLRLNVGGGPGGPGGGGPPGQ